MSQQSPRILGLMSGTSADGVDAVLLELPSFPALGANVSSPELESIAATIPRGRVLEHVYVPYPNDLRNVILKAMRDQTNTATLAQLHMAIGEFLADAAKPLARSADLISSHGQTVFHIPRLDAQNAWHTRATLQLGEAAVIAEVTRKPVIADFRPSDLAAGGQAAPLVPFADRVLFAQAGVNRVIHNLGGISNLTYLPGLSSTGVIAFDTGPANCLIDEAAELLGKRYDDGGKLASAGKIDQNLIEIWAKNTYFDLMPPKSTGREIWNLNNLNGVFELEAQDIIANVTAFSGLMIGCAYQKFIVQTGVDEIIIAGGGAYNPVLLDAIRVALKNSIPLRTFKDKAWDAFGLNASTREAAAFAVLGYYAFQGWTNTLAHTTGARRAVIAGKLTRF